MRKTQKFVSLLLAVILFTLCPMSASALTNETNSIPYHIVEELILKQHKNAKIEIVDGVINVYVGDDVGISTTSINDSNISILASETIINAPNGGLWNSFKRPWYTYLNPDGYVLPYSVVFLPHAEAEALYIAKTSPSLWNFILEHPLLTYGAEELVSMIFNHFNISFTIPQIIFLYASSTIYLYQSVDIKSFATALQGSSGKVRIDYTTLAGWPVNYYYTWVGNTVTNSPWQDFKPVFHHGIYSNADLIS